MTNAVGFDAALELISTIDGTGVDLGDSSPAYPDFPLAEYRQRYARLTALMDHLGLEALVFTQEEPVRYLTGYNSVIWAVGRWLPGAFLATRNPRDAVLIPSAFDVGAATGSTWVPTIDGHGDPMEIPAKVARHLDRLGINRAKVAMERATGSIVMLPYVAVAELMGLVPADGPDAAVVISALRMLKSPAEVDRIRTIVRATVAGYRVAMEGARIGMTEKDIVSMVATTLYANGGTAGTKPLFLNAVAGPDRYSLADAPASDRPTRDGDIMFLDGGAAGDGYISDIIRLLAFGEISSEQAHYADLAASATRAMIGAAVPGTPVTDVYQAGQSVYVDAGIGDRSGAIFGHGIGLELWERPFIKVHDDPNENIRLRPGMTVCLEPILVPVTDSGDIVGIFVFEQQVAVTDTGNEVLSAGVEQELFRVSQHR